MEADRAGDSGGAVDRGANKALKLGTEQCDMGCV